MTSTEPLFPFTWAQLIYLALMTAIAGIGGLYAHWLKLSKITDFTWLRARWAFGCAAFCGLVVASIVRYFTPSPFLGIFACGVVGLAGDKAAAKLASVGEAGIDAGRGRLGLDTQPPSPRGDEPPP